MNDVPLLIRNLELSTTKDSSLLEDNLLRLIVSNALDYDSDSIRRLIVTDKGNNTNDLKGELHKVSQVISERQNEAAVLLKEEAEKCRLAERESRAAKEKESAANTEAITHLVASNETSASGVVKQPDSGADDLSELKNRLLSKKSTMSSLNSAQMSLESQNQMHESKQETLLGDMLGLVGQLRDNVVRINESIQKDDEVMKNATNKIHQAGSAVELVGQKLSVYNNEGKLGWMFYIKVSIALVVVPLVMLAIIRIVPRSII